MRKSGMVALVGRSNVGKSTLLNALVGQKIAAVSPKAQTTRNIIHAVLNTDEGQAVFIDTPGIFKLAKDILTKKLNQSVEGALTGVDLICYIVDPTRPMGPEEEIVRKLLKNVNIPKILVINKIDEETPHLKQYEDMAEEYQYIEHVSALRGKHLKTLEKRIFEFLPEAEELYPIDQITNIDRKFWIAEIIREHAFRLLGQEIPYRITAEVETIEESSGLVRIEAYLVTSEQRHKGMIIGKNAEMLKNIGKRARKELELIFQKKVFLELRVKVDENWQARF